MYIKPIKTPIISNNDNLYSLIKSSLKQLAEKSIIVVTSKIVALCEGQVVPIITGTKNEKHALVKKEADFFIDASYSRYEMLITIKDNIIAVNAGLDRSNVSDGYVLLPKNSYESAKKIWQFLKDHYHLQQVGVLITDSKTIPLKWGTVGTALAHCGFKALIDKRGTKDLFGYQMKMTQVNVAEGLAAAAVVEMGETNEAQPLAVITHASQVEFQSHPPTDQELAELKIELQDDVYCPMIQAAPWRKL